MPVVRRGHIDGVNVWPRQQLAKVFVRAAILILVKTVHLTFGSFTPRPLNIADRDDLRVLVAQEHVPRETQPDRSDDDTIARRWSPATPQC
jgi:hypothetical protein